MPSHPIHVMMNGIPGNVAATIARHIHRDERFCLIPWSLTGPEIEKNDVNLDNLVIELIRPDLRTDRMTHILENYPQLICIDFTHPAAVNDNASFYVRHGIPFVMGTTGGDRNALVTTVESGVSPAVIAPNMAKQIVGFQAMMVHAADTFPDLFKGYRLKIRESHQQTKADTSGTAKAMVECFNRLGIPFSNDEIHQERDPERQKNEWNIPVAHIGGHAWHTYTLTSPDGTACFEFTHNINGRDIYAQGTMDAVMFLAGKVSATPEKTPPGRVYTMIDVMKRS